MQTTIDRRGWKLQRLRFFTGNLQPGISDDVD